MVKKQENYGGFIKIKEGNMERTLHFKITGANEGRKKQKQGHYFRMLQKTDGTP
jgi:hypothetical protein